MYEWEEAEKAIEVLEKPTPAELIAGLEATIAALEYAEATGLFVSDSAAAEVWAHVNGFNGSPDIRELAERATAQRQARLPEPEKITEEYSLKCTCDIYEWSEQMCSYDEDVNNNPKSKCTCCPYCFEQCQLDI